jgi:hypothetical protein
MPVVSALKNCYIQSLLEVLTDFLNCFWIQMAASLLKPPNGGFRSETAVTQRFRKCIGQNLTAINLTDVPQRMQVPVRV